MCVRVTCNLCSHQSTPAALPILLRPPQHSRHAICSSVLLVVFYRLLSCRFSKNTPGVVHFSAPKTVPKWLQKLCKLRARTNERTQCETRIRTTVAGVLFNVRTHTRREKKNIRSKLRYRSHLIFVRKKLVQNLLMENTGGTHPAVSSTFYRPGQNNDSWYLRARFHAFPGSRLCCQD